MSPCSLRCLKTSSSREESRSASQALGRAEVSAGKALRAPAAHRPCLRGGTEPEGNGMGRAKPPPHFAKVIQTSSEAAVRVLRDSRPKCEGRATGEAGGKGSFSLSLLVSEKILKLGSSWSSNLCSVSKSGSHGLIILEPSTVRGIIPYLETFCIIKEKCFLPLSRK